MEPLLFMALMRQESNFNPREVSRVGAVGLTQIMPKTARHLGMKNIFEPPYFYEAGELMERERELRRRAMALIRKINESQADILFIALGSPKQESWIQKYSPDLEVKVYQGIGGTLDVLSGQSKGAPSLIQKIGLEWLYRLVKEPKRIRRQIVYPRFLLEVVKAKFKKRREIS